MPKIATYREKLEQLRGSYRMVRSAAEREKGFVKKAETQVQHAEKALAIARHVAMLTQQQLEYEISELVSLALYSVFDSPYEFELEFVQRRNKTETDIWFSKGGNRVNPLNASGGGAVDVAAFALRVALWNLAIPKTAPVLLMDEPLKWLKGGDLPEKGARMIKEISKQLGLQIIMISHIPDQIEGADKAHEITIRKGKSHVA